MIGGEGMFAVLHDDIAFVSDESQEPADFFVYVSIEFIVFSFLLGLSSVFTWYSTLHCNICC